jgi:hypothetical protein
MPVDAPVITANFFDVLFMNPPAFTTQFVRHHRLC